ncbi:MAG: DUF4097 family beta strand repeat-containing protein [Gemmatimonadota bacterium]|jgi:DUF4097 and DUF4098 domain-containing protein YvlB
MFPLFIAGVLALSPQQQTDTTFAVRAGGTVQLETFSGTVRVRSWDQDRMRVRARHAANVRIRIEQDGSTIQVDPDARRGLARDISLEITVPRRFGAEIEGVSLEVDVADLEGDVGIETVRGPIVVRNVAGRVDVSCTNGMVTIDGTRGSLTAETVNDGIRITDHDGEIDAEAINNAVTMSGIRSGDVSVETTNGEIRYNGEIRDDGRYHFESHNGDLVVDVPVGANAIVSVDTYNGEIEADFPIQLSGTRNRRSVTFEIGDGGARMDLSSFGGTIRLRRADTGRR